LVGNAAAGHANAGSGVIGTITVTGDELFTLYTTGGTGAVDLTGLISLTPTLPGGHQSVSIAGTSTVRIGDSDFLGAIQEVNAGVLIPNDLIISITNTAATYFRGDFAAVPNPALRFQTDAAANNGGVKLAPFVSYTTNAAVIDASKSGGLIMDASNANFNDNITGASSPVGFDVFGAGFKIGDALLGSLGNDTITSNSMSQPDYITTTNGADTVNLAAGHTGVDHVGFYVASGLAQSATQFIPDGVGVSTTNIQIIGGGPTVAEWALPGSWGIPVTGSAREFGTLPGSIGNGFGTSGSNTILNNFNPILDVLDFNVRVWGHNDAANG